MTTWIARWVQMLHPYGIHCATMIDRGATLAAFIDGRWSVVGGRPIVNHQPLVRSSVRGSITPFSIVIAIGWARAAQRAAAAAAAGLRRGRAGGGRLVAWAWVWRA